MKLIKTLLTRLDKLDPESEDESKIFTDWGLGLLSDFELDELLDYTKGELADGSAIEKKWNALYGLWLEIGKPEKQIKIKSFKYSFCKISDEFYGWIETNLSATAFNQLKNCKDRSWRGMDLSGLTFDSMKELLKVVSTYEGEITYESN